MRLCLKVVTLLLLFFQVFEVFADGSKDLYPRGVRGGRAFLESLVANGAGQPSHPFYNNGKHYAYVKQNEILAVASSAQGIGQGAIRVYSPSGIVYTSNSPTIGRIEARNGMSNREVELAGPRAGYNAFEIPVQEEGIWTIEFFAPEGNAGIPNVLADENWTQTNNQNYIAAWDVSVRDISDSQWMSGRVFTNVLNLYMHGGNMADPNRAYYGVNYVLTKDGYYYRVDGNGSIGLRFTYFVNNSGFLNPDNTPSYKSSVRGYNASIHDPNSPDIGNVFITHKIFYTLPNLDLPPNSVSKDGPTWLLNDIEIPTVSNITFEASETTQTNVNTKGTKINFETNYAGRYKVVIQSTDPQNSFPIREMIIQATVGRNEFIWDGKDGNGDLPVHGVYNIKVSIASIEGEVHFPYFDMEINPNGIKLDRVNRQNNLLEPAILYWDDSDVPQGGITAEYSTPIVNLNGIPSNVNGHSWGTYSLTTPGNGVNNNLYTGSNSFGNNMAMDTWSYAVQIEEFIEEEIVIDIADLEVVSVTANKDTIELNEEVIYTIKVRNNGPSDVLEGKFEYSLPLGFYIDGFQMQSSSCGSVNNVEINNNTLTLTLDIKNGCILDFELRTHATNVPDETYGNVLAEAGVVRPRGYTDPDATLNDIAEIEPKSAREECSPNGCNNIKINDKVFLLEPYNERGQIALLKTVRHIDRDNSGFQEAGEILEYTFTIRNIGEVNLKNMVITDSMFNPVNIPLTNIVLVPGEEYSLTVNYTITLSDVQNKKVVNRAFLLAKNPRNFDVKDFSGTSFSNHDATIIDIDQRPIFQLRKTVINRGTGENGQFTIDDKIIYRFEIKHQGDIAVNQISLSDSILFNGAQFIQSSELKNTTITREYEYSVTQDDISRGRVENSAKIFGTDVKYGINLVDISGTAFENDQKSITPVARAPIAKSDYFEVHQSQLTTLKILDNDQVGSSNWDKGRIEIIEGPSIGKLQISGFNISYLQNNNADSGADYFTYRIHDNSRLMSEIVRVDLLIIKTEPKAIDDYYVQYYNMSITIQPARNDYVEYSELDLESIDILNQPLNGILEYLGRGEFKYESHKTFSGIDEFTYRIMDKNGNWSEPATVKIEVSGIFVPNVITPNDDGLNDIFTIIGLYDFDNVELQVFDRFKNIIYQNQSYKNNWEVGAAVRDGTYFYIIKMVKKNQRPIVIKGSLLITREMLN